MAASIHECHVTLTFTDMCLKLEPTHFLGKPKIKVHLFSLDGCSRKSVEDEPVLALGLVQVDIDHLEDQLIADQLPRVDDLLDLAPNVGPFGHLCSQKITSCQVAHAVVSFQLRRLE